MFAFVALFFPGPAISAEPERVSFNRDIRPIMSDSCWHCHGPGEQEAGLRLDDRALALQETESGAFPIVPGQAEASEIVLRIFSEDESDRMPPPETHMVLTDQQKELFRRWIAEGAEYEVHWSYAPLERPPVPIAEKHPIDAFVEARLQKQGFAFSLAADRRTLLRRVTLDLTGLPPSPPEIENFVSGKTRYEEVVDALLASPRFAERQAVYWLDAVRFADTRGFHNDTEYPIWPYRNYVLEAFHENMPFDQFTREQLAGDMLSQATRRQRLASAFNRLNRTSTEGGIQEKEYLAKYGADRVRTIGTVWLGQTLGCAECHDHKYDPIGQKDFYALKAFFADMEYPSARGGVLSLPTPEQEAEATRLGDAVEERHRVLQSAREALQQARSAWEQQALRDAEENKMVWKFQQPLAAQASQGVQLTIYQDQAIESEFNYDGSNYPRVWPGHGIVEAHGANPDNATYEIQVQPGAGSWAQLGIEVFYNDALPGNSLGRGNETFLLSSVELESQEDAQSPTAPVSFRSAIDDRKGARPLRYSPLTVIDDQASSGWGSPKHQSNLGNRFLALKFATELKTSADTILTIRLHHHTAQRQATIGRFRVALANDTRCDPVPTPLAWMIGAKTPNVDEGQAPPRITVGIPQPLREALSTAAKDRSAAQNQLADAWFAWSHPQLEQRLVDYETAVLAHDQYQSGIPSCFVSAQAQQPTTTRVLPRGNWMDDSGEVVEPAIPEYLGALATSGRATRLDLADWLVADENPLTARVIVNRLWAQFFGRGLAPILDDLGSQGAGPSHPQLLDWLACEFRDPSYQSQAAHRWDLKNTIRLIVTSHTYRQSSQTSAEFEEQDPKNQLLARQNRYRLDAEVIRDQALALGGLLQERFGGPSVRPYQAAGYLNALYYPRRDYPTSRGNDLWRRSLYTFWQRTFPHPTIMVFDGCTREESQVMRSISNTPLQSLVLLNDPIFVEAARGLAQTVRDSHSDPAFQISAAFSRTLARPPREAELQSLLALYEQAKTEFSTSSSASEFLAIGDAPLSEQPQPRDLAALTVVSRAILNLHESITRQ